MTTISLLNGDWEYQFEDETVGTNAVVGTRMLRYVSGPVRTTNEVYSALAAAADEFQAMGFKNPILPVTPNQYTMENQAFISRGSTEWLKEGTILMDGSLSTSPDAVGNGLIRKPYTVVTNFVAGDIGRQVTEATSGDTGTLLDFEQEPDGQWVAWIRPDDSTPTTGDIFDSTSGTLSVTGDGGTGSNTASAAGTSGITQYTAVQAIGSVPTATEVYIYQNRIKLANAADSTGFQFWSTDTAASLGIISVLIRTRNSGTLIADGDLEVFARRYTSLYDNFRLNVAAGGFSALPLASAADINNTTGYRTFTGSSGSGTFTVGNAIYVGASYAAATKKGVITAVGGTGAAPVIEYYLIGDLTDFANLDSVKEYDFTTALDGDATCTAGTPGANAGGPTDNSAGEGGTVTITLGHTTRDHDNSGTAEPYSIIVDAQSNVPIAKVYERLKYVTRRGADAADLFGAGVNVPGESYRGLEALAYYDTPVGTFTQGDDITGQGGYTARVISVNSGAAGEGVGQAYVTVTDQQTSLNALANNDVLTDELSDTVTVDTAGAGGAILTIRSPKSSPLGTFTGTQIFGAQGVDYRNPNGTDTQAYILTDDLGTLRSPPNTVSFTVANTLSGDRVYVARDTGVAGVIDKDQFGGSHATNNVQGDADFVCAGTVDGEVPATGVIRVVETALEQEHRYYYASRTTGAGGTFTLTTGTSFSGTATAGTSTTVLEDTGQTFVTDGVEVGMLIRNITTGDIFEVTAVTDEDTLAIQQVFGTGGSFASGNTYEINKLIQTYDANDNVYDLIIDKEATTTSIANTFVKAGGSFGTVVQVRRGKSILPFEQNQSVGQTSVSVTTVRTPDTVAV